MGGVLERQGRPREWCLFPREGPPCSRPGVLTCKVRKQGRMQSEALRTVTGMVTLMGGSGTSVAALCQLGLKPYKGVHLLT